MTRVDELVGHLVDSLAAYSADHDADADVLVTSLDLDLPVEARVADDGVLLMSLPRGLLATGFELPLGRLRVHCGEVEA
jgi:hypothetical protein